jgi:ABC-type antimicrobial peptide transport system permease subunit
MALGASRGHIVRMSVQSGARYIALGLALGVVSAFALARALETWFFGIAGSEAWILAAPALLLGIAGVAASWLPAQRASRVEAASALRLS